MSKPSAAKPAMHVMGVPRTSNDILADQIAGILAKRNAANPQSNPHQWNTEDAARIAKDAATIAVKAAESTKGYWQMAASEISEHRGSLDATNFAVKAVERRLTGMQAEIQSSRNNCLIWGIAAGCVSAIAMSMMFAPTSAPVQSQPITQIRSGG